jgi:hypothetical protein
VKVRVGMGVASRLRLKRALLDHAIRRSSYPFGVDFAFRITNPTNALNFSGSDV